MKLLRDAELLKKVNSLFNKEVTVEEVSKRANRLKKLRIPFIVIIVIAFLLQMAVMVVQVTYVETTNGILGIVSAVYDALCKLIICIGFLIYGKRLMRVMPVQHFARINYVKRILFFN